MPYSFVWLYLLKCVFTCSIFLDSNKKRFLSVLGIFGKYFVFQKSEKFQKQCCPVLATQSRVIQVACHSRELACWFWWLVHEWKVQSRGVHRDFRGSARNSLVGRPSNCEKHLEIFSQFCLWVFWRLTLATCWRLTLVAKNTCLAKTESVFKPFRFSLELSLSTESHPNNPCHSLQTPLLHLFTSKSSRKKVWALILSPHIPYFKLHFHEYLCWCLIFCYGFVLMFLGLFLFGLLRYCSYANLFRLIDSYIFLC